MAAIKPPFVIPEVEGWQGWVVLGLIGFMLLALVAELAPPYLVMMGTLSVLLALSIIDVKAAFKGFSDEAMLSVAILFVVAKGIEMSGGLEYVTFVLFKAPNKTKAVSSRSTPSSMNGSIVWVLLKFSIPVAAFSAFLANIPLVAMMIPPIVEFGNKVNLPPSKMLMPLSYAAQLGGTMTLIGASTNLVVLSMAAQKLPDLHMSLFEIGIVGVPITIAGIFYIVAFSGKLLPDRESNQSTTLNAREYNVVLAIKKNAKMAQKTVDSSGLGRQPGLDLVVITKDTETILNPTPDIVLQPNDRLHFAGVIDSILLLVHLNGLILTEDEGQGEVDLNQLKATQILVEAVIASGSSMVQERIADLQCRIRFNAVIVAIHRHGKRLSSLIGEIRVEAGDCLLMVADTPDFVTKHRNNSHFALVSQVPGFKPLNRKKALFSSIIVVSMVVATGLGVDLVMAALFSSAGLLLTRCLTPHDAMESIELPVLIMIAAAFGIADGMVESGAATILAKALMGLAGKSLFGLISCTYVATTLFSLAITNSAAVTIMFPVALAAANHQAMDFRPFAYTLMMAASAGFMTPTGCPTNLMVFTPGNYKFSDFINYGGPLQLWLLFVTVGVIMSHKYWYVWVIVILVLACGAIPLIARHKSTHPKPITDATPETKSEEGEHDDENPRAARNDGAFMLAPGHDNEETITRRTSQSTLPASPSSSAASFPSTFSTPFPPPYRLDDSPLSPAAYFSSTSSGTTTTTTTTRTSQTSRDFNPSSPFPPPYRLDESAVPTGGFPSIRTSLAGMDSQFLNGTKPPSYDAVASSSGQAGLRLADPPVVVSPPPQPSQSPLIPKIRAPGWGPPVVTQEPNNKPNIGPFRTRQPLQQASAAAAAGRPPQDRPSETFSPALQALEGTDLDSFTDVRISGDPEEDDAIPTSGIDPLPTATIRSSSAAPAPNSSYAGVELELRSRPSSSTDFSSVSGRSSLVDPLPTASIGPFPTSIGPTSAAPAPNASVARVELPSGPSSNGNSSSVSGRSLLLKPLPTANIGPFPTASIGSSSGAPAPNSSDGGVGLELTSRPSSSTVSSLAGRSPLVEPLPTANIGPFPTASIGSSSGAPAPNSSDAGVELELPTRPSSTRASSSSNSSSVSVEPEQQASISPSVATKSPTRSRKASNKPSPRKKSRSPRSGQSYRASLIRAAYRAPPEKPSKVVEEDLTGGISSLLSTRRLSSLKDSSSFADNFSTHDH